MRTRGPVTPLCEVPCPIQGCDEMVTVVPYREQSQRGSIFKGKFYATCPAHGRVIQAERPATQDYVIAQRNAHTGAIQPAGKHAGDPQPRSGSIPQTRSVVSDPRAAKSLLSGWNLWDWWPES